MEGAIKYNDAYMQCMRVVQSSAKLNGAGWKLAGQSNDLDGASTGLRPQKKQYLEGREMEQRGRGQGWREGKASFGRAAVSKGQGRSRPQQAKLQR